MRRVAANVLVGVAGGIQSALVVERGLNGEALTGLELVLPLGSNLNQLAAYLVADNNWICVDVARNALVLTPLDGRLVGRHAKAVRDDMGENLAIFEDRQLKLFQSKILLAVHANRFGCHPCSSYCSLIGD